MKMIKTLIAAVMMLISSTALMAQNPVFAQDVHSMNTDVYVLVGNFDFVRPDNGPLDGWGRSHKPDKPNGSRNETIRDEWDYVNPMLDTFYEHLEAARRIRTKDIQTESELRSFVSSCPLPVYALEGKILKMESVTRYDDRRVMESLSARLEVKYRVINLKTNTLVKEFSTSSSGFKSGKNASLNAAMSDAFSSATHTIITNLNDLFPTYGTVIQLAETKNGNQAKAVYVDVGSNQGLTTSNHFYVYEMTSVAGRQMSNRIGKLKVTSVGGPDISLCKVQSGGDKIFSAMNAGRTLYVESYTGFWE